MYLRFIIAPCLYINGVTYHYDFPRRIILIPQLN